MTTLKLKCDYTTNVAIVTYTEGTQLKGEKFEPKRSHDFAIDALPENIQDLCKAYGLRAILADRTSDAKANGINKLDWMIETYQQFANGDWNVKREAKGGVDRAMVHLIVELKSCTAIEAEAALKQASKEWKEAVKAKYAEELDRIRKELASAEAVDLTDL